MDQIKKLKVEILSGPLDGHTITLEDDTEWTRSVGSLLSFPWDDELGQPQSRFLLKDNQWLIEPHSSPHGTHIINREMKLSEKTVIQKGDLIKASGTWMMIKDVT